MTVGHISKECMYIQKWQCVIKSLGISIDCCDLQTWNTAVHDYLSLQPHQRVKLHQIGDNKNASAVINEGQYHLAAG